MDNVKNRNTPDVIDRLLNSFEGVAAEIVLYGFLTGIRPLDLERITEKMEGSDSTAI